MTMLKFDFKVKKIKFVFIDDSKYIDSIIEMLQASGQSWTREKLAEALEEGGTITISGKLNDEPKSSS